MPPPFVRKRRAARSGQRRCAFKILDVQTMAVGEHVNVTGFSAHRAHLGMHIQRHWRSGVATRGQLRHCADLQSQARDQIARKRGSNARPTWFAAIPTTLACCLLRARTGDRPDRRPYRRRQIGANDGCRGNGARSLIVASATGNGFAAAPHICHPMRGMSHHGSDNAATSRQEPESRGSRRVRRQQNVEDTTPATSAGAGSPQFAV